MKVTVFPFSPGHLHAMAGPAAETWMQPLLDDMVPEQLALSGYEWTAIADGQVVASAGFIPAYPDSTMRAVAWAIVSRNISPLIFVKVHRAVKAALRDSPFRRVEANVAVELTEGHRWLRSLGFVVETPCKRLWRPDGGSVAEYVYLKDTPE